ncbi:MAG TPA: hypothetical protein PKY59_12400 [Pyrinomonadaceae bacterium]|nr:hypothetical protein [Pyrinomonadaceae bacterium]
MPKRYSQEAVETARKLYCKFDGKNFDEIEKEMQKTYPEWKEQNLHSRGKGKNARLGWIIEYNFDKSLEEYRKTQPAALIDDVQNLYLGIKKVRESLQEKVVGGKGTRDDIYAFRDYANLEMKAREKLDLEKDNFETFVVCFEKFLAWLPDIDEAAATAFLSGNVAERILEKARIEYGEIEETESES